MDVRFRFLGPDEAEVLSRAIRAAYGDSYDLPWVYDRDLVSGRFTDGTYLSCVAESERGELLCHSGLSRSHPDDLVGHSGQAVTMPAARGQHLFTRTKQHLMDWAREHGMAGMYSEATAAHPYSQKANIDLGAVETGFLLGWIPATVDNDAATGRRASRQSAALFYTKLGEGHGRPVYAPEIHHEIVAETLALCKLRGRLSPAPADVSMPLRSQIKVQPDRNHNLCLITVTEPGADLEQVLAAERHHRFHHGVDAVYIDLPLDHPATALTSGHLERLGLSYSGIFPNPHADGDMLRLQSLHRARISAEDVAVASEHGQRLLEYVLADAARR